jgi:carbon storage regulator CsrA
MLVLSRKSHESIVIGGLERRMIVTVIDVRVGQVKLGIEVADDVPGHLWEVWQRIKAKGPVEPAAMVTNTLEISQSDQANASERITWLDFSDTAKSPENSD